MNQSNNHPGIIACDGSFFLTLSPKKTQNTDRAEKRLAAGPNSLDEA